MDHQIRLEGIIIPGCTLPHIGKSTNNNWPWHDNTARTPYLRFRRKSPEILDMDNSGPGPYPNSPCSFHYVQNELWVVISTFMNVFFIFQFTFPCANTLKFRVQFSVKTYQCKASPYGLQWGQRKYGIGAFGLHTFVTYPRWLGLSRPDASIMLTTSENSIGSLSVSGLCGEPDDPVADSWLGCVSSWTLPA